MIVLVSLIVYIAKGTSLFLHGASLHRHSMIFTLVTLLSSFFVLRKRSYAHARGLEEF